MILTRFFLSRINLCDYIYRKDHSFPLRSLLPGFPFIRYYPLSETTFGQDTSSLTREEIISLTPEVYEEYEKNVNHDVEMSTVKLDQIYEIIQNT